MLTFLEHEANIWYGSNINAAARSTYKYVVTGVSCGGTLANPSRKCFIAALLKSLSILFGIRVITVSTGTATHINEMKARHAKGVILESEKDPSTHTLCMGLPTSLLCIHSIWRVTLLATVELVWASFTVTSQRQLAAGGNYVYNNPVSSYVVAIAIFVLGLHICCKNTNASLTLFLGCQKKGLEQLAQV